MPVRFDDRLRTVLAQPVGTAHDRAVRWRQLVELLARGRADADGPLIEDAIGVIRSDAPAIDEKVRAATARAVAGLPLPPALIAAFAADTLAVAAPILAATSLEPDELQPILREASADNRRFLAGLHPGLREEPGARSGDAPASGEPIPSIGEVVARVERLRQGREPPARRSPPDRPGEPIDTAPSLFRWECNASGEIAWVEGAPRGALIGRSLARAGAGETIDPAVERAIAQRAPFRDASLTFAEDGALAGEWRISGVPAFKPADGRFAGYRGIALRAGAAPPGAVPRAPAVDPDHDSLRELVHEIKTPLNAIIGFAEIIDGQYLGPAHHRYRERAAEIVAQARRLLEAVEDLDFAAKLQSGRADPGEGTPFGDLFPALEEGLREQAILRGVDLDIEVRGAEHRCAMQAELATRLLRRFLESVIDAAAPDERLALVIDRRGNHCTVAIDRPGAARGLSEAQLLDTAFAADTGNAALGLGFALRLVRGLASVAGGALEIGEEQLVLLVPAARSR